MKNSVRKVVFMAGASVMALAFSGAPSYGQSAEELQRQIDKLQQSLNAIKAAQGIEEIPEGEVRESSATEKAAPLKVEAKAAPRFSGDGFSNFKLRGRTMVDFASVGNPNKIGTLDNGVFTGDPGLGTTSEIRRARLGVEGTIEDWAYKFELDYADNEVNAADAFVQYKGLKAVTLTVGHQKTPVSMEENTSSRYTAFMERGMFTDAFGFSRELGVTAKFGGSNWSWTSGVFAGGAFSGDDEANGYGLASRAHYSLPLDDGFLHVGGSVEYRDKGEELDRYRSRPGLHTTDTRLVDTGALDTQSSLFLGAELAGSYGPFSFAAEYGTMDIDLIQQAGRDNSARMNGAFVHMVYHLTGEKRGYKMSDGLWDRTKPLKSLGQGGFGAVALNLGFDWLDLDDSGAIISGGEQLVYQLGLTWIPMDYVRFIANFNHTEINNSRTHVRLDNNGQTRGSFGLNSFGLRAQVDW